VITAIDAVSTDATGVKHVMALPPSAWHSSAVSTASLQGQSVPHVPRDGAQAAWRQAQTGEPASNVAALTGAAVQGVVAPSSPASSPESVAASLPPAAAGLLDELQPISTMPAPRREAAAKPTK
jgi:hypothetical protein